MIDNKQKVSYMQGCPYAYYQIPRERGRKSYERFMGNLTRESLIQDMKQAAEDFLYSVPFIVKLVDENTQKNFFPNFELDTYAAEVFYEYAVEGVPRFFMRRTLENGLIEMEEDHPSMSDAMNFFGDLFHSLLAYNSYFNAPEESFGGGEAYSLRVLTNMAVARFKLDYGVYTGDEQQLSIHEVSLLAGMKEPSVRNAAGKEFPSRTYGDATKVQADHARDWLQKRRNFTSSTLLELPHTRQAFIDNVEARII